jgi:hypothetical protein
LTLHPAGFDESEHCGGYAGLSHDSGVAPKVADATSDDARKSNRHRSLSNQKLNIIVKPNIAP